MVLTVAENEREGHLPTLHAEDLPASRAGNGQKGIERLVSQRREVKAIQQDSSTHPRAESPSIRHEPSPLGPLPDRRQLPRVAQSLLSRPTVFVHHQLPTALEVPAVLVVPAPACELLRLVSGRNSHEHAGTPVRQRRKRNLSVRLS